MKDREPRPIIMWNLGDEQMLADLEKDLEGSGAIPGHLAADEKPQHRTIFELMKNFPIRNIVRSLIIALSTILALIQPLAVHAANPDFTCPVKEIVGFGNPYGIWTWQGLFHHGLDFANAEGTPVYAGTWGEVTQAGWSPIWGYGNSIEIDNGVNFQRYAHLSEISVWGGQVEKGQYLGTIGSTGNSFGPHLHYEIWWEGSSVDPNLVLPCLAQ